jgi:hypothetical protein
MIGNGEDHVLFNKYFHADNGAGLGANQTGWAGIIARLRHR